MTRGEIRNRILEGLNDSSTSPAFWSLSEIDGVIEEGKEILAEELAVIKRSALVPLREGTAYYYTQSIASDIMIPYRIYLTHLDRRLEPVTIDQLDRRHETWATVDGDPWHWFPVSWDIFGIWPVPASAGGVMRIDYLAWPDISLDDDDEIEFPESTQDALVIYGVYDGLLKQWDIQRALQMFGLFIQRIPMNREQPNIELQTADLMRRADAVQFKSGVNI